MRTLRSSDLKAVADLIDALALVAPEQVPGRLVAGVLEVVPGVLASYNEFGPGTTLVTAVHPDDVDTPGEDEAFVRFLHQHPVIAAHGPAGIHSASTISDYATPRRFRRLDLYQELYRPLGIADQITSNVAGPGRTTIGLAISRARWGFTERDRLILDLLHPYLGLGPARAARLAHLRRSHRALAGDPAHSATAIVVLTRRRRIAWLTPPARRLLADWFGYAGRSELPPELAPALALERRPSAVAPAVRLTRGGRTLTATLLAARPGDAGPLLALEQTIAPSRARTAALGLTAREGEILLAAADGLLETAIARRLAIAPRTVNKHLENIYRKLDVTDRRQAVAVAFASA
jgi:DNA-binding CsgD family transcriptional regulator